MRMAQQHAGFDRIAHGAVVANAAPPPRHTGAA
jgi:hypothetical protein